MRCRAWLNCVGPVVAPSCCSPFLTQFFRPSHKFAFSEVRIFDQIGFGRQKSLGLQNRGDFENDVFPIFPGRGPIFELFGAFSNLHLRRGFVRFGPLPEICLRLRCGWFFRVFRCSFVFFFRDRFSKFVRGSFANALSSFCVLLFSAFSSSAWVDATLHVCFGAVGPKPFFSFCFFVCLFTKTVFSPLKKGLFLFISQCLNFFLLGFLHFSFSFPVSLFLLFIFFCPSLLFCFFL